MLSLAISVYECLLLVGGEGRLVSGGGSTSRSLPLLLAPSKGNGGTEGNNGAAVDTDMLGISSLT